MRKYQSVQVQDRNVDTWYDEYDETMDNYESKLYKSDGVINETMICDFASTLTAQLGLTKQKIQLVSSFRVFFIITCLFPVSFYKCLNR